MVLSFFAQSGSDGGHSCGGQCVYLIPGNAVVLHATGKWTLVGGSREVEIQESGRVTFSECSVLSLPTPVGRFFPLLLNSIASSPGWLCLCSGQSPGAGCEPHPGSSVSSHDMW